MKSHHKRERGTIGLIDEQQVQKSWAGRVVLVMGHSRNEHGRGRRLVVVVVELPPLMSYP